MSNETMEYGSDISDLQLPAGMAQGRGEEGRWGPIVGNAVLVAFGLFFVLPLVWLLLASVDSGASWGLELPHFTWQNYAQALNNGGLASLGNSLLLAGIATFVSTATAVFAAYALVRYRVPWKGPLLLVVLFLTGIPISIIIVPVYQIYVSLGWLSIVPSAIFLGVTSLPMEIWLLKNYIEMLPKDMEEAAKIEQASTLQILSRIILPSIVPGIGAAAIFGFINAWGSFVVPLVLISSSTQVTGPVTIYSFISASDIHYGAIAAFSIMYSIPVFVLYALMSRVFQGGFFLGGAVKG